VDWVISHRSALEFWRKASARAVLTKKLPRVDARPIELPTEPLDAGTLHDENYYGLTLPLEILVGSSNARKVNRNLICHTYKWRDNEENFVRVSPGLAVCSPELCFVQLANRLSLIELIEIGYELCGGYRLDKLQNPSRGFRDDFPLTSVADLSAFIDRATRHKGLVGAARATQFILDNSKSPRETTLAMLLTLPYRLGGYGFEKPRLNYRIDVSGEFGKKAGKQYFCDLFWPEARLAVEYDSDAYHALPERIAEDAIRKNDLTSVGITVYTMTNRQVTNSIQLQKLAKQLSRKLDKRLKLKKPEFDTRHNELRQLLLFNNVSNRIQFDQLSI